MKPPSRPNTKCLGPGLPTVSAVEGSAAEGSKALAPATPVAAARELRDRWLEKVNEPGGASALVSNGKYDVCKELADASYQLPVKALPIAA